MLKEIEWVLLSYLDTGDEFLQREMKMMEELAQESENSYTHNTIGGCNGKADHFI
jgi:hypothetical protein